MIRILHTADLLLDHPFAENEQWASLRRDDQFRTFEKLINLAIKNEVDLAVFAGNLFATARPEARVVETVCQGLQRLVERNIVPVILPGGLDGVPTSDNVYRIAAIPGLVLSDYGRVGRPVRLHINSVDVHLYGFVWGGNDPDPEGLSGVKRQEGDGFHIGVFQAGASAQPDAGFRTLPLIDAAQLESWGLDYAALGNHRNWMELSEQDRVLGVFPGTPEGITFRETGQRFCSLVTLDGQGPARVERLPVNSRSLEEVHIDVTDLDGADAIADQIRQHAQGEILLSAILTGEPGTIPDLPRLYRSLDGVCAGLILKDRTTLFEGKLAEALRQRGRPFSALLETTLELLSQASEPKDRRLLEEAFREALLRLEHNAENPS